MEVAVLPETLAVCRLHASDRIPSWALELHEGFVSITRTPDELSIVCPQDGRPARHAGRGGLARAGDPRADPVRDDRRAGRAHRRRSPRPASRSSRSRPTTPTTCWSREQNLERALHVLHADPERQRIASGSPYEPVIGFSRAVRAGDRVLVSGTGPVMPDGGCPESTADQARRCWEIVLAALAEAGASASDVVRTRTLLTPAADAEGAMTAHGEVFADVRPASTMVVVHALLDPRWTVEVEAEAQLDA